MARQALEPGTCEMRRHRDGTIEVLHADPVVWISGALLRQRDWRHHLHIEQSPCWPPVGATLRIDAVGGPLIYVLRSYDAGQDRWLASWPD